MLTNYHTHHYRCKHAGGTIEDYVVKAIKEGYAEIGMSCHVPYENFPEVGTNQRMEFEDLPTYFEEISDLQKKYPEIKILKSVECEYFPKIHQYLEELAEQTDYLILAGHFIEKDGIYKDAFSFTEPWQLEVYAEQLEIAMATGFFKFLAHSDLFMIFYPQWDETCEKITHQIAQAANKYDMLLEVNANGLRYQNKPYPKKEFWSIIATCYPETKVIVNSDCHDPELLNDDYMKKARQMAEDLNLNIVTQLGTTSSYPNEQ